MFKYHNNYTYCSSHNQLFLFIAAITPVVITQLFFREASNNLRLVFTIILIIKTSLKLIIRNIFGYIILNAPEPFCHLFHHKIMRK